MRDKSSNRLIKIVAILVLLPIGLAIPFLGIESQFGSSINAQTADESLQQRIANYKKRLKSEIKKAESERIKLRCEVAKANIENLSARVASVQKKRNTAYSVISTKLEQIYKRLEAQAFETSELKTNLDELFSKMESFTSGVKSYKQAVDDMKAIDCKDNPEAFIAALTVAREQHAQLITLVDEIREYLINTIKPTLEQIKKQVEAGQTVGGDS